MTENRPAKSQAIAFAKRGITFVVMNSFVKDVVEGALVADAYSLGTHWIYDGATLASLKIDWEKVNDPKAQWHNTKQAGQFTHYGDQLVVLYEYTKNAQSFVLGSYMRSWYYFMRAYNGYIDAASQNTLENIKSRAPLPCGFASEDLSVAGRIAPLLALAPNQDTFLADVDIFTRATHYTKIARDCSRFCGQLLWRLSAGESLHSAISEIKNQKNPAIGEMLLVAQKSAAENTIDVIRRFGAGCNAHQAMPGALHLLFKYKDNYKSAMIENAKSGGDSSARGMVAAMLMVAAYGIDIVPNQWRQKLLYKTTVSDSSSTIVAV